jgi:hypothetical protein
MNAAAPTSADHPVPVEAVAGPLRRAIVTRAAIIGGLRGVSTQTALADIYGGPIDSLYSGAADEAGADALPGVLFTASYLCAAMLAGESWEAARRKLAAARKFYNRVSRRTLTREPSQAQKSASVELRAITAASDG